MKLYYFADGCSLATHICLREAGIDFEAIEVDPETRLTRAGLPFNEINARGYVPALVFDDGSMLTENVAILDWIGQQAPSLTPADGMGRTRLIEALAFMSTEIHKQFLALFFAPGEEGKPVLCQIIGDRFAHIAERLKDDFLLGDRFSPADAFLYVMVRWAGMSEFPLPRRLLDFSQRVEARPAVRAALEAEGLSSLGGGG
jgi:glutathione S-transferase